MDRRQSAGVRRTGFLIHLALNIGQESTLHDSPWTTPFKRFWDRNNPATRSAATTRQQVPVVSFNLRPNYSFSIEWIPTFAGQLDRTKCEPKIKYVIGSR